MGKWESIYESLWTVTNLWCCLVGYTQSFSPWIQSILQVIIMLQYIFILLGPRDILTISVGGFYNFLAFQLQNKHCVNFALVRLWHRLLHIEKIKTHSGLGFGNTAPSLFTTEYSTARLSVGCHVISELYVKIIIINVFDTICKYIFTILDPEEILISLG